MTFSFYLSIFLGVLVVVGNLLMIGYMIFGIIKKTAQAPYVSSFDRDISTMKKYLNLKSGFSLIDLGCGDGKAMRFFANTYGLKCVGFDINLYAITIGKIITYFHTQRKNIHFNLKNFFLADLSTFDYIYVYLLPGQLKSIESWIWKHKKKESIVISNTFQFVDHKPFEIIENDKGKKVIFLYR